MKLNFLERVFDYTYW